MSEVTVIHAADIHLDSPMRGLERYESAPVEQLRGATREAFKRLMDLCLDEQADLLLIAGDLFDGDLQDYNAGLFLAQQLARLQQAGTETVIIRGNHDAEGQITKKLHWPQGVHDLSTKKPQTKTFDTLQIAVHGQGYAVRDITTDLTQEYPQAASGFFNIGLLHTALTGRDGHEPYAPTRVEQLATLGYDYWALGHVHKREVVSESPYIVFPGNLQGRHAKETGPKGATLFRVVDGEITELQHKVLDVVRWHHCPIDLTDIDQEESAMAEIKRVVSSAIADTDVSLNAIRIELVGSTPLHTAFMQDAEGTIAQVRALMVEMGEDIWIEKVKLKTTMPIDLEQLRQQDDTLGALLNRIDSLKQSDGEMASLIDTVKEATAALPNEYRQQPHAFDLSNPEQISALLDEIVQQVIPAAISDQEGAV